jgi:alkylhydroperoxidase family enzyme
VTGVHRELVARLLEGDGHAPLRRRRAAFENAGPDDVRVRALVEKVAERPTQVTDDDLAAAMAAGLDQDQVWEVVVCAAVGAAARQYESALGALDVVRDGPEP